jgi:hypothetical protein
MADYFMTASTIGNGHQLVQTYPASRRGMALAIAILWAVAAAMLMLSEWRNVTRFEFADADDMMRMLEVRNWLAGASWFDVSQPRMNPPTGGIMHWSRLVDVPIAAINLAFRPFVGAAMAEQLSVVIAPLVTLAAYVAAMAAVLRRIADGRRALFLIGMGLVATMPFVLLQMAPTRVDHHGWQITLGVVLLLIAFAPPTPRVAAWSGAVIALLLSISLEGLPLAPVFGALWGFAYLRRADRFDCLAAFLISVTAMSVLLHIATRGWWTFMTVCCDGMSLPYFGALAATTATLVIAARIIGHDTMVRRVAVMAIAGVAGIAAIPALAPVCAGGPFAQLDPTVIRIWYNSINEGRPIWVQLPSTMAYSLGASALGIAGTILAWLRADVDEAKRRWGITLFCLIAAVATSTFITRAMGMAHAFAVPGVAFLCYSLWTWARMLERPLPRVLASVGVGAVHPVIAAALLLGVTGLSTPNAAAEAADARASRRCDIPALTALPQGIVFAPLDISPTILVKTRHSAIAGSYHRNHRAIRTVIEGFTQPASRAEAIVRRTGARYVAMCPTRAEVDNYADEAARRGTGPGLVDDLRNGRTPAWLEPVPTARPATDVRVWRVLPKATPSR